jgi:hypothetical protein
VPLDGFPPVGLEPVPLQAADAKSHTEEWKERNLSQPSELELRLAQRPEEPPPPPLPLVSGVYTFPWYPQTLMVWLSLSVGALLLGLLIQLLMDLAPV